MSNRSQIWQDIELAIRADKKSHPNWPDHAAAQAGKVCKEAGLLMRDSLDHKYDKSNSDLIKEAKLLRMKESAVKTAAMAIRFLENLK